MIVFYLPSFSYTDYSGTFFTTCYGWVLNSEPLAPWDNTLYITLYGADWDYPIETFLLKITSKKIVAKKSIATKPIYLKTMILDLIGFACLVYTLYLIHLRI